MEESLCSPSEHRQPPAGTLTGTLVQGDLAVPVRVALASRLSLRVTFEPEARFADGARFTRLKIPLADREVELTGCEFRTASPEPSNAGELIFVESVYDCRALISEGRLVDLAGLFRGLPLMLGQREGVVAEFREWVSELTYDLAVHRKFFSDQDRIFAQEPPRVVRAAQAALIAAEGPRFFAYLDEAVRQLVRLVSGFDAQAHERHGFYFRRQLWEHIVCSRFLERTNLKPRGYAGDAEMMQLIYENQHVGRFVFDRLMHKYPIGMPAAQAVRNRRHLVAELAEKVVDRFPDVGTHGIRLLSVACGPAWELQDIFRSEADLRRYHVTLLDQDPEALSSAKECVRRLEAARGGPVSVRYLGDSVRTMLRTRDPRENLGRFHFIYSMGLFDYLTPPVGRAVLEKIWALLEPSGTLVVGNYHVDNPDRIYMAYWADWTLYHRTEAELLALAERLEGARASLTFDQTRCQMFLRLDKAA